MTDNIIQLRSRIKNSRKHSILNISGHNIDDDIMQRICRFNCWKDITIFQCKINIPDAISRLMALERLTLVDVHTLSISDEIMKLSSLQRLSITDYNMTIFPDIITHIPNLEELCIQAPNLIEIPKSIMNLQKLKNIRIIDYCGTIPNEFAELQHLDQFQTRKTAYNNIYIHDTKMIIIKFDGLINVPSKITHLNILDYVTGNLDCLPISLVYLKIRQLTKPLMNLPMSLKFLDICWDVTGYKKPCEIKLPYGCELKSSSLNSLSSYLAYRGYE
ncbi:MAG: hypothetical protein Gaeavirus2_27 [Gaeavirus sp.]|uniref:Leucine-rich repeat protein n=1 Tax=Gaeavirus sp. TaxID=2487767 RepID=A0A3G4ZYF0_9VIRU|nr:MAG: hypothetical protein Gaeavirus2_27 [Gaeavirus sp.]